MYRKILISFFLGFSLLGASGDLDAQRREPIPFKDRLWYGGGFSLGFSSSFNISLLQAGISPMMGYKLSERWSVGPRTSVVWSYYRAKLSNDETTSAHPLSWSVSGFTRYKLLPRIFAQAEYEYERENIYVFTGDKFEKWEAPEEDKDPFNYYLGGGYHSGDGLWGFEIVGLYNLNPNIPVFENPFVIRFGVTYRF